MRKLSRAQSVYLDFIRGMAAMGVLFGHAGILFLDGSLLNRINVQSIAVFIFFLLSGFLISYGVLRKYDDPSYGFKQYFIDRFCRIYCAFLPALIFVWLADMQTIHLPINVPPERIEPLKWITNLHENFNALTWIGNLFMMQDFPLFQVIRRLFVVDSRWFVDEFGSASPFWTISIEWWIYIVFGVVVLSLIRDGKRLTWKGWTALWLAAIVPAYYAVGGPGNCLTFLWLMGMAACLLFFRWNTSMNYRAWRYACVSVFAGSLVAMAARLVSLKFDHRTVDSAELQFSVFLALAVFSMLFMLRDIEKIPAFIESVCKFVAGYSYSLYLTHMTVILYLYLRFPGNDSSPHFFWLAIVTSNVIAIVFWWLFERHYRTLAKKIKSVRM